MSWKGGPCFYCHADLDKLMIATHSKGSPELAELYQQRAAWGYEEFDRHMRAICIADPSALNEWHAVINEAEMDLAIASEKAVLIPEQ